MVECVHVLEATNELVLEYNNLTIKEEFLDFEEVEEKDMMKVEVTKGQGNALE